MDQTEKKINKLPAKPGVYLFRDLDGQVIYVGKAIDIRERVKSHFHHDEVLKEILLQKETGDIECVLTESEFEALILEASLIRQYQPRYNVVWKDDRHYLYLKITYEEFPKLIAVRKEDDNKSLYFGPFPSSKTVREVTEMLRRIFPFCTQKRIGTRACFYTHLGLCHPCPSEIVKLQGNDYSLAKRQYRDNIRRIKMILSGKGKKLLRNLRRQMEELARKSAFEEAALIRDQIGKITYLTTIRNPIDRYLEDTNYLGQIINSELNELRHLLKPYYPDLNDLSRIECYDISNLQGNLAVGSQVTFIQGEAEKSEYKRYRIRRVAKPNDYEMIREVLKRRLNHQEWPYPNLIVVDGGRPQVSGGQALLDSLNLKIPLLGLAKRQEEIILRDELGKYTILALPRNSYSLRILQKIRDESHRFAHKYHTQLRMKHLLQI